MGWIRRQVNDSSGSSSGQPKSRPWTRASPSSDKLQQTVPCHPTRNKNCQSFRRYANRVLVLDLPRPSLRVHPRVPGQLWIHDERTGAWHSAPRRTDIEWRVRNRGLLRYAMRFRPPFLARLASAGFRILPPDVGGTLLFQQEAACDTTPRDTASA